MAKISKTDYQKHRENYITPRGEFNPIIAEKTRERVKNKTHHLCDPEFQKYMKSLRGPVIITDKQKMQLSISMYERMSKWENKNFNGKGHLWLYAEKIYVIYLTCDYSKRKFRNDVIAKVNIDYPIFINESYWIKALLSKFKVRNWNPIIDQNYQAWKNSHESL